MTKCIYVWHFKYFILRRQCLWYHKSTIQNKFIGIEWDFFLLHLWSYQIFKRKKKSIYNINKKYIQSNFSITITIYNILLINIFRDMLHFSIWYFALETKRYQNNNSVRRDLIIDVIDWNVSKVLKFIQSNLFITVKDLWFIERGGGEGSPQT